MESQKRIGFPVRQTARAALEFRTFFIDSVAAVTTLSGIDRAPCSPPPSPQCNQNSGGLIEKLEALAGHSQHKNERQGVRPFAQPPRIIQEGILRKTNLDELWERREDADYVLRVTRSKFLAARTKTGETPDSKEAREELELARKEYGAACAASREAHEIYSRELTKYNQAPKKPKGARTTSPSLSQGGYI